MTIESSPVTAPEELLGQSLALKAVLGLIDRVADTDATVLVEGERGTGKKLTGRILHARGPRASHPLISQNCSILNETLLAAELFGYVRGAFPGAINDKEGLVAAANGGTLLLDEISDLPPTIQARLVHLLETGTYAPIGSTDTRHTDVRLLATTCRDLPALADEGVIRRDLLDRLTLITIHLPPLRDRLEDLPLLADHFVTRRCGPGSGRSLDSETVRLMMNYTWPGNVGELEQEIDRLIILAGPAPLFPADHLSPKISQPRAAADADPRGWNLLHNAIRELARQPWHAAKDRWVGMFGRPYLEEVLKSVDENVSRAAKVSGLPRSTFYRLLHKHGLMRRPH